LTPARRRLVSLATVLCACAAGSEPAFEVPYQPDRRDEAAFREAHPEVEEPNYLAFMAHRTVGSDGRGDVLFLCRWPDEAMPLTVWVSPPAIPDSLQDEFDPQDPQAFVDAVLRALATWERELEGLVRFRLVEAPGDARLELRLLGEEAPAPHPDLLVLGKTPIARACHARDGDPGRGRLDVDFQVPRVDLYLADYFGLLAPDQVEWIALHEIGHALGMRSHSPIPADVMYEVVRDRVSVRELSLEDVNSFVSLYRLPNGTVYTRIPPEGAAARAPAELPQGPPQLAIAPYVDARLGFELRPPAGWMRVPTARGVVLVDGVTWDYTASFQIVVHRYPTLEAYMQRYGAHYLARGQVLEQGFLTLGGRRAFEIRIGDPEGRFIEQMTFIETGDGRVFAVIADSPVDLADAYRPWFAAALSALEIRPE
jgi:predicted Zn-dependent protease